MAIFNGVNGRISGKIGDMVFYIKDGSNYIRKAPVRKNPPSALQLANQKKVAVSGRFLNPLRSLIEKVWGNRRYAHKTGFGSALSYMIRNAFTDDVPVPRLLYDRIHLSKGRMPLPLGIESTRAGNSLLVKWSKESASRNSCHNHDEDQAVTVLYFPEKEASIVVWDGARRCDEQQEALIPAAYSACTVHAWLIFTCSRGLTSSATLYLGEF